MLLGFWIVGFQIVGFWIVGFLDCRAFGLSGLLDCRVFGLSFFGGSSTTRPTATDACAWAKALRCGSLEGKAP